MDAVALAGCLIIDDYDRLLLLHRNTDKFQHWELPGGKLEIGETPAQAAVRELREELGVIVRLCKSLGNATFEDMNGTFRYHWFLATITDGEPTVQEPDTFDDWDFLDLADLPSLSLSANMQLLEAKLLAGELVLE